MSAYKSKGVFSKERCQQLSETMKQNWKSGKYDAQKNRLRNLKEDQHPCWVGDKAIYETVHIRMRKRYLKKYCEKCGVTHMMAYNVQNRGLALHCVNKDIYDNSQENWVTYCTSCHTKVHAEMDKEKRLIKKLLKIAEDIKKLYEDEEEDKYVKKELKLIFG